jgi:hypothetical protein
MFRLCHLLLVLLDGALDGLGELLTPSLTMLQSNNQLSSRLGPQQINNQSG